ncbi:unnamed protein product [Durusdinium trenchii]|uniref:Uncharacterized protein n=1 Tax=Durusdinium trenchii TaxID=1381693 RepID=A0ABP0RGY5_9DINO
MLQELGIRYAAYSLKAEYFHFAEQILFEVLATWLGSDFTKEVEFAWKMVSGFMVATMLAGFVCSKCWLKLQTALRKAQLLVKQRRAPGWLLFCQMNRMLSEVSLQQKKSLGLSLLVDCCLLQFTVKAVKD